MDQACANKLMDVFDSNDGEVGEIARCLGGERLQHLFDTTRGCPDGDFLIAILIDYEESPKCDAAPSTPQKQSHKLCK